MLLDRSRRAGPHLEWKVRAFVVGAVLGAAGIYLDDRRITGAAIVVLLVGVLIRFLPGGRGERPGPDHDDAEGRDAEGDAEARDAEGRDDPVP